MYQISLKIDFQCSLKLISIKKVPWNFLNNIWTTLVVPWIPWNLSNETSSSMEFHEILSRSKVPKEVHGTFSILPSSMEFNGIPWNFWFSQRQKIIFLSIVVGIWLMIRCHVAKISQKRYILHWFQYRNSYFEHPSVSENDARSAKMACCY